MADKKQTEPAEDDKSEQATPDDVMNKGEMKPILNLARKGTPVSCAVALTKDKEAVLLLDRKTPPKKLVSEMKKQSGSAGLKLDANSVRFGRASVDADVDSGLLSFAVNKKAPAVLRAKLLVRVKAAGFSKVAMTIGDGKD